MEAGHPLFQPGSAAGPAGLRAGAAGRMARWIRAAGAGAVPVRGPVAAGVPHAETARGRRRIPGPRRLGRRPRAARGRRGGGTPAQGRRGAACHRGTVGRRAVRPPVVPGVLRRPRRRGPAGTGAGPEPLAGRRDGAEPRGHPRRPGRFRSAAGRPRHRLGRDLRPGRRHDPGPGGFRGRAGSTQPAPGRALRRPGRRAHSARPAATPATGADGPEPRSGSRSPRPHRRRPRPGRSRRSALRTAARAGRRVSPAAPGAHRRRRLPPRQRRGPLSRAKPRSIP